jgi:hypothetical protein
MVAVWALAYQLNRARRLGPSLPSPVRSVAPAAEPGGAEPEGEVHERAPLPS